MPLKTKGSAHRGRSFQARRDGAGRGWFVRRHRRRKSRVFPFVTLTPSGCRSRIMTMWVSEFNGDGDTDDGTGIIEPTNPPWGEIGGGPTREMVGGP